MVDIHCHALYGVDDGADDIEESVAMLSQAKSRGVEAVVLTPHYRHGMFSYPKERILEHFENLKPHADKLGVDIHLGCEYHVNSHIIEALSSGRCLTMAGGDFVLTEYSFETGYSYINEQTRKLLSCGYVPVIAHAERYGCLLKNPKLAAELSDTGAWIQINADSVLGLVGKPAEKFCRKLLKHGWADIIASDAHGMKKRVSHMAECQEHVQKKYGADYAEILFEENPGKVLG